MGKLRIVCLVIRNLKELEDKVACRLLLVRNDSLFNQLAQSMMADCPPILHVENMFFTTNCSALESLCDVSSDHFLFAQYMFCMSNSSGIQIPVWIAQTKSDLRQQGFEPPDA